MTNRIVLCSSAAMLRIISVAALSIGVGGCAYFHPAFVTQDSKVQSAASQSWDSVLVCERRSLTRKSCARVSRDEMDDMMTRAIARY